MRTQFDWRKRVVSLDNLRAMCKHCSGMSYRFEVESFSPRRVYVSYSNPNEYGWPSPQTASFPCYPGFDGKENPAVVLDFVNITNDRDGDAWQNFHELLYCPPMHRNPETGEWAPEYRREYPSGGLDSLLALQHNFFVNGDETALIALPDLLKENGLSDTAAERFVEVMKWMRKEEESRKSTYEVIVGNVGSVYHGRDLESALIEFLDYVEVSVEHSSHRAYGKPVTMMRDNEIAREFIPPGYVS